MATTVTALEEKIRKIYPEIDKNKIHIRCHFDEKTEAWMVEFQTNGHTLETHLEREDVDACLGGRECVHMGVQIGRFVESYCLRDDVCPVDIKK